MLTIIVQINAKKSFSNGLKSKQEKNNPKNPTTVLAPNQFLRCYTPPCPALWLKEARKAGGGTPHEPSVYQGFCWEEFNASSGGSFLLSTEVSLCLHVYIFLIRLTF